MVSVPSFCLFPVLHNGTCTVIENIEYGISGILDRLNQATENLVEYISF